MKHPISVPLVLRRLAAWLERRLRNVKLLLQKYGDYMLYFLPLVTSLGQTARVVTMKCRTLLPCHKTLNNTCLVQFLSGERWTSSPLQLV